MKFTPEQDLVITDRGCNMLVSAAAGSGKTTTMVGRILHLLVQDHAAVDKMLIVTFTNAAAASMKAKLQSELIKEIAADSGDARWLQKQLDLLHIAPISTMHSFCRSVVASHFHQAGVDPGFKVAEDAESRALMSESMDELFESRYESGDPEFWRLLDVFAGSRTDQGLRDAVENVYAFSRNQPDPSGWLDRSVYAYDPVEFLRSPSYQVLVGEAISQCIIAERACRRALRLVQEEGLSGIVEGWIKGVLDVACSLQASIANRGLPAVYECACDPAAFNQPRKCLDSAMNKEEIQSLMKQARDSLKDLKQDEVLGAGLERLSRRLSAMSGVVSALCTLVNDFAALYMDKKLERGVLDFGDLEHFALKVLASPGVAQEYRDRFTHIFIDEYQDSNAVQEAIVSAICNEHNTFMVGDVKQSIYQFRSADPSIFLGKYRSYTSDGPDKKLVLSDNFRSSPAMVDALNYLFERIMSPGLGDVAYDKDAALRAGRTDTAGVPVELHIIREGMQETVSNGNGGDNGEPAAAAEPGDEENGCAPSSDEEASPEELERIEKEAALAVSAIRQIMAGDVQDKDTREPRLARYSDIAVLLRAPRSCAWAFVSALSQAGIPAYADYSGGWFDAVEVETVLNLLRAVDNSRQDIPLLAVMRSPVGSFTIDELIEIRAQNKGIPWHQAVRAMSAQENGLGIKIRLLLERLDRWRSDSLVMPLEPLIWKLYGDTGYYDIAGALPGGAQRRANLRALAARAGQFEHGVHRGIWSFLRFVDRLRQGEMDINAGAVTSEGEDAVRIMSVHRSKGLEFPAVIVSGLARGFNQRDARDNILCHKDLGIGVRFLDPALGVRGDTAVRRALALQKRSEALSEEMRVLYVALTRARDRLVLTGVVKADAVDKAVDGFRQEGDAFLLRCKNPMQWLVAPLLNDPDTAASNGWDIRIHDEMFKGTDVAVSSPVEWAEVRQKAIEQAADGYDEFARRMEWVYPHLADTLLPTSLAASGAYRTADAAEYIARPAVPAFAQQDSVLTGAGLGTVMHTFMSHLDLDKPSMLELQVQLGSMVEKEMLSPVEAAAVRLDWAHGFADSSIGRRAAASGRLLREEPFVLLMDAKALGLGESGEIPVQGVIDCCFLDHGGWVLIDYKTDNVTEETLQGALDHYRSQLGIYEQSLERLTGISVKEKYLYLMRLSRFVQIP